jgi:ABC-2 type transport system permease protein
MSVGTYTPAPGAAPLPRMIAAQTAFETKMLLRNGEQLLLTVVIPSLLLVLFSTVDIIDTGDGRAVDFLAPGVLALAVMSTAFTGQAIATGFERRYGVIKRLGASPLPRSGLLMGKIGGLLVVELMQVLVIGAVGLTLGWRPHWSVPAVAGALLALLLGTFAFASLGLFLAGVLRAEATLAAANLVYLLLMAGGAVVLPADAYGGAGHALTWLPSGALGEAMRAALTHGDLAVGSLLVLACWGALGTLLTAKTFTWE